MCGRYHYFAKKEDVREQFDVDEVPEDIKPNYNVAPTHNMPVITRNSPNKIQVMRWGLIPSWAKDAKIGFKMINARAEGVESKPSFRHAFKKQRCIVPASGFYEWRKENGKKIPYFIHPTSTKLFGFAGLYEYWKSPEGQEIHTYTIITTEPNVKMKFVHDRMPVILKPEDYDKWLDRETSQDYLIKLLYSYPDELIDLHEVSTEINSVKNNFDTLSHPLNSL